MSKVEGCTFSGCTNPGAVLVKGYLVVCIMHSHFYDETDQEPLA